MYNKIRKHSTSILIDAVVPDNNNPNPNSSRSADGWLYKCQVLVPGRSGMGIDGVNPAARYEVIVSKDEGRIRGVQVTFAAQVLFGNGWPCSVHW